MNTEKPNDGGPAFPEFIPDAGGTFYHGATLRDYFAAAALPSVINKRNPAFDDVAKANEVDVDALTAAVCYRIADYMLEAREQ